MKYILAAMFLVTASFAQEQQIKPPFPCSDENRGATTYNKTDDKVCFCSLVGWRDMAKGACGDWDAYQVTRGRLEKPKTPH